MPRKGPKKPRVPSPQQEAAERVARRRAEGGGLVLITACEICALLPHKLDLGGTEAWQRTPGLEALHVEGDSGSEPRYAENTEVIERCAGCGTCYHHDLYVDREDAFCGGPSVRQHLQRYNPMRLLETLGAVGKHRERDEALAAHPALCAHFAGLVRDRTAPAPAPNLRPFLIEALTDALVLREDWAGLTSLLLRHVNPDIALDAAYDLTLIYGEPCKTGPYPFFTHYRDFTAPVKERVRPWLSANRGVLEESIRAFEGVQVVAVKMRVEEALRSARYYGLVT